MYFSPLRRWGIPSFFEGEKIKLINAKISINSLHQSKLTQRDLESNSRKLSSGNRITRAGDDAAGLSIAAKLNSKNRSKDQANRNVNQAVSIVQIMDGALSEMSSIVTRVRELAVQSASDTYSDRERRLIEVEARQLVSELARSAQGTKFQDNHLLRGDNKKLDIQVDIKDGKNHRISLDLAEFSQDPVALGIGDITLDNKHQARLSLVKLDYATKEISRSRAKAGAFMSRMETTGGMLESGSISGRAAHSQIKDTDYATETAENVKNKLISNSQTMVQSQVNNMGSGLLKLLK